jgi:hypothetical protein
MQIFALEIFKPMNSVLTLTDCIVTILKWSYTIAYGQRYTAQTLMIIWEFGKKSYSRMQNANIEQCL